MNAYTIATMMLFMPAVVCFICFISLWLQKRNDTQTQLLRVLSYGVFYFFSS